MPVLSINSDAVVAYAAKLEKISRSALPVAVRRTLTAAALDVKTVTMPDEFSSSFTERKKTFKRATSRVEQARGLNIETMQATVGFMAPNNIKESGHATQDLEEQEHGGDIDKRAFIATAQGRTGRGNVKDAYTMSRIKAAILNAKNVSGKNRQERFVKSAIHAGNGGFVIGENADGKQMLSVIRSVHRLKSGERSGYAGGHTIINSKPIYTVEAKRKAHVKATHFMQKASEASAKKMEGIFIEYAQAEIAKVM